MNTLRIGDVAELTGIPASTLRYYEQIGVLPEARREGGQRRYGPEVVTLVGAVKLAIRSGFSLGEIREARAAEPGGLQPARERLVGQRLRENEREQLRLQREHELLEEIAACPCSDLSECELVAADQPRS